MNNLDGTNKGRVIAGCRALHGCDIKQSCLRYQAYLQATPFVGFNAEHYCITEEKVHYIYYCSNE